MKIYITGKGLVSAAGNSEDILELPETTHDYYIAKNPDFTKYFDAKVARRTSKILKMSLVAAYDALNNNFNDIDGIIVGTGIGCIGDSEKFITALIQFNESMLSPTPFIQSTHNTVAGSIALQLQKHTYNLTYSERIFSFEWALLDAIMHFNEVKKPARYLVGSADELTPNTFDLAKSLHLAAPVKNNFYNILRNKSENIFIGEHAAFFTLSNSKTSNICLSFVKMFYQQNTTDCINEITNALPVSEPDCLLIGINGHTFFDNVYNPYTSCFETSALSYYKHLCGESFTSSSFALWLAIEILKNQQIPKIALMKNGKNKINNVLILNHFRKDYLSAIFISNEQA